MVEKESPVDLNSRDPIIRGAWRDHCFPAPFSWFLHKTGQTWRSPLQAVLSLKCQKKDKKNAKEHCQFCGVLGRCRTAATGCATFHACQRCQKIAVLAVIYPVLGLIWRVKAFNDQQYQLLARNKGLGNENNSNFWTTFECVHIGSIWPWVPAASTVDVNSQFSRFQLSAFSSSGFASIMFIFAPISLRFFFSFSSSMKGLKYIVTDFSFNFDLQKKSYASLKPTGLGKTTHFGVFRPYLDFQSGTKVSVTKYFALGCIEVVK